MIRASGARIAVVGPATLLGKELLALLDERAFPARAIELFEEAATAGRLVDQAGEPTASQPLTTGALEGTDIAFCCVSGPAVTAQVARAEADRVRMIDAAAGEVDAAGARHIVAGVNDAAIEPGQWAFRAASAAAVALATVIASGARVARVRSAAATVLVPASDSGQAGIDELYNQTLRLLNFQQVPHEVFGEQLAFNLLGDRGSPRDAGRRIVAEVDQVLAERRVPLAVATLQAPLFYGTTILLRLEAVDPIDAGALQRALAASGEIEVHSPRKQPSPISAAGSDRIHVAVVSTPDGGCWLWLVLDNVRRGRAINAVRIAERLLDFLTD